MDELNRKALMTLPLAAENVGLIYHGHWEGQETIQHLCASHERLRKELSGAEIHIKELEKALP